MPKNSTEGNRNAPRARTLLVFNSRVDEDAVALGSVVDLFALKTDTSQLERLKTASGGTVLPSARLIDDEVRRMRSTVPLWSAAFAQRSVRGRRVIDRFMLRDGLLSAWWFNALAEKNPLKTDLFLHLAQLQAIASLLETGDYGAVVVAVDTPLLRDAVVRVGKRFGLRVSVSRTSSQAVSFRARAARWLRRPGPFAELALGCISLSYLVARALRVRLTLPPLRPPVRDADLVVSFWAASDGPPLHSGPARNRYFEPLRALAAKRGRALTWLSFYVPTNGLSHREAVLAARRAIEDGEALYLAEEFVSLRGMVAALVQWSTLAVTYGLVSRSLGAKVLAEPFFVPEAEPLIRRAMRASCLGVDAVHSCWYHELLKASASFFAGASHCIYPAENQAWERSLNVALRRFSPGTRRVGFQHTTVAKSHFFYRFAGTEPRYENDPAGLPQPDVFVVNGRPHCDELRDSGYAGLVVGEALRHMHLGARFDEVSRAKPTPPLVLIAGSSAEAETLAMLQFCKSALESTAGYEVRFVSHPLLSTDVLCRAGEAETTPFANDTRPIARVIDEAAIVIVATSSVWLDALSGGCRVAAVALPDALFADPFVGAPPNCQTVYSPEELRALVKDWTGHPLSGEDVAAAQAYVRGYWQLDEALPQWSKILYEQAEV